MPTTVLLVEHKLLLIDGIVGMLHGRGHRVVRASVGADALNLLQNRPFDLLIGCLSPEKLNGSALALASKRIQPQMPVLLIGGIPGTDQNVPFADAVVQLPYTVNAVRHAVQRLLRSERSTRQAKVD